MHTLYYLNKFLCLWIETIMPKVIIKANIDVPPVLIRGKVTPTTGNIPQTIPALIKT